MFIKWRASELKGMRQKKSGEIIYILEFSWNMISSIFWKLKYLQSSGCSVCLLRLKKGEGKTSDDWWKNRGIKSASRLWLTRELWIPEMTRAPWACQESQRQALTHSSSAGTPRGPDMMRRLLSSAWLYYCSTENQLFTQGRDRRCFREHWPTELNMQKSQRANSCCFSSSNTNILGLKVWNAMLSCRFKEIKWAPSCPICI